MKIGVIQASSQSGKNRLMYEAAAQSAVGHEVVNFGCFPEEAESYSYIEISLAAGLLLHSRAVDFIVTGCSSGQGMALAMNSLPGVLCGYAPSPRDAYLFAQINDGNAISMPLGEDYAYSGAENLRATLSLLFSEPFGQGYPKEDAERKTRDTRLLKSIRERSQIGFISLMEALDGPLIRKALAKRNVADYILFHAGHSETAAWIRAHR